MKPISYVHGAGMVICNLDTYITDDFGNLVGWWEVDMDALVYSQIGWDVAI